MPNVEAVLASDVARDILSEITVYMKYSRYLPKEERRETWEEIADRNKEMHIRRFPKLKNEIEENYKLVYNKKVLPSMRSMQFAGKPIEINNSRVYNCAYMPVEHVDAFSETMFLLLGGTGVGYSVQKHHVEKLPVVKGVIKPQGRERKKRYLVGDSIEGWSDAVKVLVESWFYGKREIEFDYRDIRPKGARLITSGGKAPGPAPLRECLVQITNIFENTFAERGYATKLKPIEVHDVFCHIADAVLAGGIRRAAMISLFSMNDEEMATCKLGEWWEEHPERGRANNSAVIVRNKVKKKDFVELWKKVEASNSGEPGLYFTNDKDWGANPCVEIALRPYGFCNLTEINASNIISQEDFNERSRVAAFIGTLQASYTDFHYLREEWRKTAEKDALLGVSMTGIASGVVLKLDMEEAANTAIEENERVAEILGINKAARVTTVKPSGTTSLVLGTSSGIHAWHNGYYIRRIRVGKNEAIYSYLSNNHPELLEDEYFKPDSTAVISIPQKAPSGAVLRVESPLETLERVKQVSREWIAPGHINGMNSHNVSCTISLKDEEWDEVGKWMWDNREFYNGIAVIPYDGGTYIQAPFEDCSKYTYEKMLNTLSQIDLTRIIESQDETNLTGEIACGGGACEIDIESQKITAEFIVNTQPLSKAAVV